MEELAKYYLLSKSEFLCEKYLIEKGISVFQFQSDEKIYFRIKIGNKESYKNIVISLQEILVFLFESKQNTQQLNHRIHNINKTQE